MVGEPDLTPVWHDWPYARIQQLLETRDGTPILFVYQLEYNVSPGPLSDDDWRQVARFDHDASHAAHDVGKSGLHMDVHKDGGKEMVVEDFPPVNVCDAPDYCYDFLTERADQLLAKFERWHMSEIENPQYLSAKTRR